MSTPRARHSWRRKLAIGLAVVLALLAVVEFVLGLAGVKPTYLTRDRFADFEPGPPLFVRDGDQMKTNPAKIALFNSQSFAAEKASGTYRVFCLGDSTAFGYPYDDRVAPSGWLRAILTEVEPDRDWEVVNCGGISHASYRSCLLMQELVQYEPDLFILCIGQDELLEDRFYGDRPRPGAISAVFDTVVARTRLGSLAAAWISTSEGPAQEELAHLRAEPSTILDRDGGPSACRRDDQQRERAVAHFRDSLDRMCGIARSAGARVILVKPAANLRSFRPFASEHGDLAPADRTRWQEAVEKARKARMANQLDETIAHYQAAAELDPRYAQVLWETGDALFAAKRYAEAKQYFVRSVDEDVCTLRAVSAVQAAIEKIGTRHGASVIDFARLLETAVPGPEEPRILGGECFVDHAHPTIEANQLLGWALFGELAGWNVAAFPPDQEDTVRRVAQKVLSQISPRDHAVAQVQVIRLLFWAGRVDEALQLAEKADRLAPGLPDLPALRGRMLEVKGRPDEAMAAYGEAFRCNQEDWFSLSRLAFLSLERKRFEDARAYFATALLCTPPSVPLPFYVSLRMGLGMTFGHLKQWKEAAVEFQTVLKLAPDAAEAKKGLAAAQAELAKTGASPAKP